METPPLNLLNYKPLWSKMQAIDQAKAQELITQLERQQQGQIQCLQALFGLFSEDNAKRPEVKEEVKGTYLYTRCDSLPECCSAFPYA